MPRELDHGYRPNDRPASADWCCGCQALSEELRIDRSVMVSVCDDLERAEFVRRERNPEDRRPYAVTITDLGRRRSRPLLDDAFEALTAEKWAQLIGLLRVT